MTATVSATLEREHRAIDDGVEAFADCAPAEVTEEHRAALRDAIGVLRRHIYLEEEFLFPPLRAAGLVGPVMVMVHEHAQMWPLLDQLDSQLATGVSDTAGPLCRDLLDQLAAHNMKEERILYPQADGLPAGDLAELTDQLATARIPGDWVCLGAT